MSKSITRAISEVYGLNVGVQKHVSPAVALEMGFARHEMDFISRLAPDCWLALRMDDFDLEVQLSFFVVCGASSQLAAPLRIRKKARGLTYMHDAEFCVSGGKPVAHCTVLLRKRRRNAVMVSFLEKDRTVRTKGIMNLGQSLLAVSLRAMMPFCAPDADVVVQAADDGSGRLLRYYQKLGMKVDGAARVDSATPMRASLAHILRTCSPSGESGAAGALSVSEDVTRKRGLKRQHTPLATLCRRSRATASLTSPRSTRVAAADEVARKLTPRSHPHERGLWRRLHIFSASTHNIRPPHPSHSL